MSSFFEFALCEAALSDAARGRVDGANRHFNQAYAHMPATNAGSVAIRRGGEIFHGALPMETMAADMLLARARKRALGLLGSGRMDGASILLE